MAFEVFTRALADLRADKVKLNDLVVTARISHDLEAYKSPTPAVRAAKILMRETGQRMKPGQKMKFIYVRGDPDVYPWEMPGSLAVDKVDKNKYIELLVRAASSVLYPFGIDSEELRHWANTATIELRLNFDKERNHVRTIYDHVGPGRFPTGTGIGRPTAGIHA